MKLRTFFTYLAAGVSLLLLIGGIGFFWLASHNPLNLLRGVQTTPAAAMLVPRQAPLMVSLLVNPERLAAFRQVITPAGARRQSRSEWHQFRQTLLASTGLDYRSDIQPWLGDEITFAVTTADLDRDLENGRQPGYLLALTVRKPEASRRFLERFWQQQALRGQDLVFEQYQGVKLIYSGSPSPAPAAVATVATAMVGDRFVLLGNHPKVLRSAINNIQAPDLDLGTDPAYQQGINSLEPGRIGLAFVNLEEWASQAMEDELHPRPGASLAVSLGLDRQGLLAETAVVGSMTAAREPAPQLTGSAMTLRYIPARSNLVAVGVDLDQLWTNLTTRMSGYDLIAPLIQQPLQDLGKRWGLDLPQEVFSWVKGEYAVALVPTAPTKPEWVFVAEQAQPAQLAQGLQHLDAVAQTQGLGISPLTLAGQPVTTWTRLVPVAATPSPDLLSAQVVAGHITIDRYAILASSLATLEQSLAASPESLLSSKSFQQAIAPLPQPNAGYLYLDWPASRAFLEQQFPLLRAVEAAGQPLFRHLRSLTLTSYASKAPVQRSRLFIRLT